MTNNNEIQKKNTEEFNFQVNSLETAMSYAKMIAESDLAPKDYKGKPGNVLIAMQFGSEIGLKPLQAIQNIAVINGRPTLWGDAMIALVQNHPLCEYIHERFENDVAYCTVKRRTDDKEYTYEFSKADAKTANLLAKPGVWSQYPERMMQMRARSFALRDKFSDVLKGIAMREEVQDYVVDVNKKEAASEKVAQLIQGKNKPQEVEVSVKWLEVQSMIENATTLEELHLAAVLAKDLDEEDREKARAAYKIKSKQIINLNCGLADENVNLTTGEIKSDDQR